jgi:hypothetical protein
MSLQTNIVLLLYQEAMWTISIRGVSKFGFYVLVAKPLK